MKSEVVLRLDESYYLVVLARAKEPRLHGRLWPALHEMAWHGKDGAGNMLYRICRDYGNPACALRLIQVAYIDKDGDLCRTGHELDLEEKIMFKGWQEQRPQGDDAGENDS